MLQNQNARAERTALIEVDDVFGEHADAAGGHIRANGPRFQRAVQAITQILPAAIEIHGTRTERIVGTGIHELRQIGLALTHFRRRDPARPQRLAVDAGTAEPTETVAAHTDPITKGGLILENHIKKMMIGIDHHGALRLGTLIFDELAAPLAIDLLPIGAPVNIAIVFAGPGEIGQRSLAQLADSRMSDIRPGAGYCSRAGNKIPTCDRHGDALPKAAQDYQMIAKAPRHQIAVDSMR